MRHQLREQTKKNFQAMEAAAWSLFEQVSFDEIMIHLDTNKDGKARHSKEDRK